MRILILGAGYGGLRAALDLHRRVGRRPHTHITLVNKHDYHQFRTELHKTAAGTVEAELVRIPLRAILAGTSIHFVKGVVEAIRPRARRVDLASGESLAYHRLVVALGSDPEYFDIPGLREHALTIQTLNSAQRIRQHIEMNLETASRIADPEERRPYLTVVVGGGGLTGVEFVAELADRLPRLVRRRGIPEEELRLITIEAASEILAGFDRHLVEKAQRLLARRGIELRLNTKIRSVRPDRVELEGQPPIYTRNFIWAGGVRGNAVVEAAFTSNSRGRALVNEYLQSVDFPDVYIIGDCALALHPETGQPVAPTAQNAIAQGRLVARNIAAELAGRPLERYRATNYGMVASLGRNAAIASIGGIPVTGIPAVMLKDLVTLRYVWSIGGPGLLFRRILPRPVQLSESRS